MINRELLGNAMWFYKLLIGLFFVYAIFINDVMAEDDDLNHIVINGYEDFKEQIELPFQSLKLIAALGNENLSFNLWAGFNAFPDYLMKYVQLAPSGADLSHDYFLRSIMEDSSLSKDVRKERIRDFIRNHQVVFINEMKSESKIINDTLINAFEEDMKGAIDDFRLHKKNRISRKWKENLLAKIDDFKVKVGGSSISNIDNYYNSLPDGIDKINLGKLRAAIKNRNAFIADIGNTTTFKILNVQLNKLRVPAGLDIAGAGFDLMDIYGTYVKFIDKELTAKSYVSSVNSVASLLALSKFFRHSKAMGWVQVIEGTRQITENNVKIASLLDDSRYFTEAIKDVENDYLNPQQMQQYYTYYASKIVTDIQIDTIYAQQAIKGQNFDLMMAHLDSIERTREFARELKKNDTKGYLDKTSIIVSLLGLNVDAKLLNKFDDIINASYTELIVNFCKAYEIATLEGLDELNNSIKMIDGFIEDNLKILLEVSGYVTGNSYNYKHNENGDLIENIQLVELPDDEGRSFNSDNGTFVGKQGDTVIVRRVKGISTDEYTWRLHTWTKAEDTSSDYEFLKYQVRLLNFAKNETVMVDAEISVDGTALSFTLPTDGQWYFYNMSWHYNKGDITHVINADSLGGMQNIMRINCQPTNSCQWLINDQGAISPTYIGKLKRTGQEMSYQDFDDGYYQAGLAPVYNRNNETDILMDNITGIEWLDNGYNSPVTLDQAISYCNNVNHAGFDDWRTPNIYELQSIIMEGKYNPALDMVFQKTDKNGSYWSSTGSSNSHKGAWGVHFGSGRMNFYYKYSNPMSTWSSENKFSTICIRGKSLTYKNYERIGSIVRSLDTELSWQDDTSVSSQVMNWDDALNYCNTLSLDQRDDWRLPNQKELMTISDFSRFQPALNSIFKNYNPGGYYWASTTFSNDTASAWDTFSMTGMASFHYIIENLKKSSFHVRCVRGGFDEYGAPDNSPSIHLLHETYPDNSPIKSDFVKAWAFSRDITDLSVSVLSNDYLSNISSNSFSVNANEVSVNLTPNQSKIFNKLVLQFKNAAGNIVKVNNSDTFWSKTRTNHRPVFDPNMRKSVAGLAGADLTLPLKGIDADGDPLTFSIIDSTGSTKAEVNGELLTVNYNDSNLHHELTIAVSDGKEQETETIAVVTVDSGNVLQLYDDVDEALPAADAIAYATLQGLLVGTDQYTDSEDYCKPSYTSNTGKVFKPLCKPTWFEALKMLVGAAGMTGRLEIPTENLMAPSIVAPEWISKYYTLAKRLNALPDDTEMLHSPDNEAIARLLVRLLGLDDRVATLDLNLESIAFDVGVCANGSENNCFTSTESLYHARLLRFFGLFMTEAGVNPKGYVNRGELAMVMTNIARLPSANLVLGHSSVERGDILALELANLFAPVVKNAGKFVVDMADQPEASGHVKVLLAIDGVLKQDVMTPVTELGDLKIDTSSLPRGTHKILLLLENMEGSIRNIIGERFEVTVTDSDADGVQDRNDRWPLHSLYAFDENSNGIPDFEDSWWGLDDINFTEEVCFEGEPTGYTYLSAIIEGLPFDGLDDDGDGAADKVDAFPLDATESLDTDKDGKGDNADNCPTTANADQKDLDGDKLGDACDPDRDDDNATDDKDAFPDDPKESLDTDKDGKGNNADTDDDNDGLTDTDETTKGTDPLKADTDGDGVNDKVDVFPNDPDESVDADGDGIGDNGDNCPATANPTQSDKDTDGMGDACDTQDDTDSDADGIRDAMDNCPAIANPDQADKDADGIGDACDSTDNTCTLDIDGNGQAKALTDGLLTLRYLFNFRDAALVNKAVATDAQRKTAADISAYLQQCKASFDVDGNGQAKALTDGLLILRYQFNFRGNALVNKAVAADATRKTAADIEPYLQRLYP